jgi:hypothetical protein
MKKLKDSQIGINVDKRKATQYFDVKETAFPKGSRYFNTPLVCSNKPIESCRRSSNTNSKHRPK